MKKFLAITLLILLAGCTSANIFKELGDNIAGPNGMVIDEANNRLYLINSNSNVLYNWLDGSVQIYDITDPLAPVLLKTIPTDSYSGEAFLDATRKLLYTTNRFSEENNITEDHLLAINIDEASADYGVVSSSLTGANPYGLYCCYPADRMWISTGNNDLEYVDLSNLNSLGSISLNVTLSNGSTITQSETAFIAVKNNQAFVPRSRGGLYIINLDEVGVADKYPVDYFIDNFTAPWAVATDGTYVYLVDEEQEDDYEPLLFVIDPATLVPLTDNTMTEYLNRDDTSVVIAQITVAKQPKVVFLTSQYAFVTCGNEDDPGYVSVVDLASRTLITNITVGQEPFEMALYETGGVEKYLYVGDVQDNTITIIDIATLTVVAVYPQ